MLTSELRAAPDALALAVAYTPMVPAALIEAP